MQSRILQVTQLGNFSPGFPGISSMTTIRKAESRGLIRVVPVNCTIARLRGSSRPDDDSALVADPLGNTLSYSALEIMPPATQCGQMISYVFASYAFSVATCYSPELTFFPLNH
jgi:hypothetical protein